MHRFLWFISLSTVTVLAILFASYFVLTQFDPNREMRQMVQAMNELETVQTRSALSWTRGAENRETSTVYLTGQIDLSDTSNINYGQTFRAFHLDSSEEYADLAGEVRYLDSATYLTYIPPGPSIDAVSFDQPNVWVSFVNNELEVWGSIIPGLTVPVFSSEKQDTWSSESIAQIRQIIPQAQIIQVIGEPKEEILEETEVWILDVKFYPERLRSFLLLMQESKVDRPASDAERIELAKRAQALESLSWRLWIDKNNHLLHRLQASGAVKEEGQSTLTLVDLIVEFYGFNEVFEVMAPVSNVFTLQQLLGVTFGFLPKAGDAVDILSKIGSPLGATARLPKVFSSASNDLDNDGLENILEGFYGTDLRNPDTDGDGMNDGDEVRNGQNPRGKGSLFGFGLDNL